MVRVRGLRNKNLDSKSQRPSDMPSPTTVPSHSAGLSVGDSRPLPETSTGGSLAEIALFSFEVVTRICATMVGTISVIKALAERVVQERSSSMKGVRVTADDGSRDLECCTSKVT